MTNKRFNFCFLTFYPCSSILVYSYIISDVEVFLSLTLIGDAIKLTGIG